MSKENTSKQNNFNYYSAVCQKVLNYLPQKQRKVIERRFGLKKSKSETLQSIGSTYGITRERVRQIENEGLSKLKNSDLTKETLKVFAGFADYLKENGGLKREDILLQDLGGNDRQNEVGFLLRLGNDFYKHPEKEAFFAFWSIEPNLSQKADEVLRAILNKLARAKEPMSEQQICQAVEKEPNAFIISCLEASKAVEKGPLGAIGLVDWPEIKPRGVKDVAFLALKKRQAPLHFREIAKEATAIIKNYEQSKEVLPQTVHNELIRDPRFVLVGRGVYGLQEWGYLSGTVKEIIMQVLRKAKHPLRKQAIVQKVREQRFVKENTILLNLADKNYFQKTPQGRYKLLNI